MDTMKITEHGHKTTGPFLLWLTPDHLLLKTSNFTSSRPGLFPDSPNDILGCCTQVVHKFFNLVFLLSFLMPMWYYYTYTQPSNHVHFIHLIPQACQVVNLIPPSFFFFLLASPWGMWNLSFLLLFIVVQLLLFLTPWTAARQSSLSITVSWSLLRFVSVESMMLSSHLILCYPLLLFL